MTTPADEPARPAPATVIFEQPIKRGDTQVHQVTLRKPNAGELRGLSLIDVVKLEIDAIIKLIPRISTPTLLDHELATLSPADIFALSTEVANFFLPQGTRVDAPDS